MANAVAHRPTEWTPELRAAWSAYRKAKDAFSEAHDGFEAGLLREEQASWERFQTALAAAREQQAVGANLSERPETTNRPIETEANLRSATA